ncbi:MAG: hypothetical protein ACLSDM_04265 [Butyricicoccus sp.]
MPLIVVCDGIETCIIWVPSSFGRDHRRTALSSEAQSCRSDRGCRSFSGRRTCLCRRTQANNLASTLDELKERGMAVRCRG